MFTRKVLSLAALGLAVISSAPAHAYQPVESKLVPLYVVAPEYEAKDLIVLRNDSFVDGGSQAYLQLGFIKEEMAGVWVQVPQNVNKFKIDFFRVLMGDSSTVDAPKNSNVFFQMGLAEAMSPDIPVDIQNSASVTPGPYWNDIPAKGEQGALGCATGGQFIGAALEFTHAGSPSIYRDLDGLANPKGNVIMAIPGGWGYSVQFGLRGDWVLRVVGHEAGEGECP